MNGLAFQGAAVAAPRGASLAYALLVFLVLALQFGPLVGLIGFRLTEDSWWTLTGAARDIIISALSVLAVQAFAASRQRFPLPSSAKWAMALVLSFTLMALLSSSTALILALNLRRLALVPLLFLVLLLIPWTSKQIDALLGLVVWTSVLVALIGVIERLSPTALWTDVLDIGTYTAASGFDRFGRVEFPENGRFFSWDFERWVGSPVRRMVSSYLEPTTLAAAMAVLTVMARARLARGYDGGFILLLAFVCGLATLSKGYLLFIVATVLWRLFGVPSPRQAVWLVLVTSVTALVAAEMGYLEGPFAHVAGLASGLHFLVEGQWLGEGIGSSGGLTDVENDVGHESGFGSSIAQIGLAALLPIFWVRAIAIDVLGAARRRADPGGPWMAAWVLFWLLTYMLSGSSQGVGGNALGFAMLALYLHPSSGGNER